MTRRVVIPGKDRLTITVRTPDSTHNLDGHYEQAHVFGVWMAAYLPKELPEPTPSETPEFVTLKATLMEYRKAAAAYYRMTFDQGGPF